MKWVTRERPKIDRLACPWLIARFIDDASEFVYVPADRMLAVAEESGAIRYDIPGVERSHVGERCSFDAFLATYQLCDHALLMLAAIVRGADTARLDLTPQPGGLYAISLGLSAMFDDDHEVLGQRFASCRAVAGKPNIPCKASMDGAGETLAGFGNGGHLDRSCGRGTKAGELSRSFIAWALRNEHRNLLRLAGATPALRQRFSCPQPGTHI